MSTHRQHEGLSLDNQGRYLTVPQTRHDSKLVHDNSNSILLALATTLPMSCFPIENVPASERYGALDAPPQLVRNHSRSLLKKNPRVHGADDLSMLLKPESTWPGTTRSETEMLGMSSVWHAATTDFARCNITAYACPENVGGYGIGDVSVSNTASPLSTSTISSAWTSELSPTEPTFDLGTAALVHTILPTSLDDSFSTLLHKSGSFTDNLDFVSDIDCRSGCNAVPPSGDKFFSSPKAFPSFENQIPALPPTPALPIAYSDRRLQTQSPFKIPTISPITIPQTNPSVQQSTPELSNNYSPPNDSSVQPNEGDDFLNKLGDIIDWDVINCPTPTLENVQKDITNIRDANSVTRTPMPDHYNLQAQDPDLYDTLTAEETLWWDEFLLQAKKSASLFEMLDEQHQGPLVQQ